MQLWRKKLSDRISPLDIDDGLNYYYLNVLISYRQISELKDIVYESYKNFNEDELSARKDIIDLIGNLDCLINELNEFDGKNKVLSNKFIPW